MKKKVFALLLAALMMVGLLPMSALADGETEATAEALAAAIASGADTIRFAAGDETITLDKPLMIDRALTIELNGQTITAAYDINDSTIYPNEGDVKVLTVFNILPGGNLTLRGEGTVYSARSTGDTADSHAFYLHSADAEGKRSALAVAGSTSGENALITVRNSPNTAATLFAVGSKASLTLKCGRYVESEYGTAIKVLNGASGYSLDVYVGTGLKGGEYALVLSGDFGGDEAPHVNIGAFQAAGYITWVGTGRGPRYSELTGPDNWAFHYNGTTREYEAVPDMEALLPTEQSTIKAVSFFPYRTVTYAGLLDTENPTRTVKVPQGQPAPNYTPEDTADQHFVGWDPALTDTSADTYTAQWAAIYAVTGAFTDLSSDGAASAFAGQDYTATLTPATGFDLPAAVTVKYADDTEVPNVVYDAATGAVTVPAGSVTGPFTITAAGVEVRYNVTNALTELSSDGSATVRKAAAYTATLTPAEGYRLPASVTVKYADDTDVPNVGYDAATGVITVPAESVTADFTITAAGYMPATYTVTNALTNISSDGDATVTEGSGYSAILTPAEGYKLPASVSVKYADDTDVPNFTFEDGILTIPAASVTGDFTVTAEAVQLATYAVTNALTGLSSNGAAAATEGSDYVAVLTPAAGYSLPESVSVTYTEGGEAVSGFTFESGTLTVPAASVTGAFTVTAAGVPSTYAVTLPSDPAYTITVEEGSSSPVSYGGAFSFRVNVNAGYAKTDDFAVKANDTVLAASGGVYTVSGIQADQTVTVAGVQAVPTISSPAPQRSSASEATFYFTSSQTGSYYYRIEETSAAVPTAAKLKAEGVSGSCTAEQMVTIPLTNLSSAAARYIYILVENASGVQSSIYRINLPAYVSPTVSYSVTLPTGTGYTAAAAAGSQSPVTAGSSYSFTVNVADGYRKGASFNVASNGIVLKPDANGVYTIPNIQAAQTVTVAGLEAVYTVTLNNGTGYSVNPISGSVSPVAAGGSYSFTVNVQSGYQRSTAFSVKANNATLQATNGVYTIYNINTNQNVTVTGVTATTNNRGGTTGGGTATTAPSITTTTLTAASLGQPYSQQLTATGTTPITWTYTGSLPDGITLGSTNGLLSGTPTAEGTFRFAVKASNTRGTATRQMTLVVSSVTYTVTSGNNAQWTQGTEEGLTFQSSGKESFTVQIDGARVDPKYLTYSTDNSAVTVSSEYLKTLATGAHNVVLVYKNGTAKAKFNIRMGTKASAPTISAQPINSEVKENDSVTFNVTATGTAPMSYQWQVDKGNGMGYTDVVNGNAATLTVKNVSANQNGWKYRCVVTNATGKTESSAATLTVRTALGNVGATASATASPAPETQNAKRSPIKTILGIALGVVVAGLAGVGGVWLYRKKKYEDE